MLANGDSNQFNHGLTLVIELDINSECLSFTANWIALNAKQIVYRTETIKKFD